MTVPLIPMKIERLTVTIEFLPPGMGRNEPIKTRRGLFEASFTYQGIAFPAMYETSRRLIFPGDKVVASTMLTAKLTHLKRGDSFQITEGKKVVAIGTINDVYYCRGSLF